MNDCVDGIKSSACLSIKVSHNTNLNFFKMDIIETLLKLPESERQKLAEALLLLKNVGANAPSSGSDGKPSENLKDSLNISNNSPEKHVSKQKTLDSWIVKNKTPSTSIDKVPHSKKVAPTVETEVSKSNDISTTSKDQLPCSSSTSPEKYNKSETEVNSKMLMVLLNREDGLESNHKSPEKSKNPSEKPSGSSIKIKSTLKKPILTSENSDKNIIFSEERSPTPPRSYNLRSARGNSIQKEASLSSNMCVEEENNVQETDTYIDINSKGKSLESECMALNSELKIISANNNETVTDENLIPIELDATLNVKGKRKGSSKGKNSKKLCTVKTKQQSLPMEINDNSKSAQSTSSKKATKSNSLCENPSESQIDNIVLLSKSKVNTSPNQTQSFINDTVKSDSKLKLKKTLKRKHKADLNLCEKTKFDSTTTKVKKKNLPDLETDSVFTENVDFQNEIPDNQFKSRSNFDSQNKGCADKTEEFFIPVKFDSKRECRKQCNKKKSLKGAKNRILSDSEMSSKVNDEDGITLETSSKSSPHSKEGSEKTDELLINDTNTVISEPRWSTKISRKKSSENKSMKPPKKNLLYDSKKDFKSNDNNGITSIETSSNISPSLNNEFDEETRELPIKDTNTIVPTNINSKKEIRKIDSEDKISVLAKNSLSESGKAAKNDNEGSITSTETSPIDSSENSPSQSLESSKVLLINDTDTETSVNVDSKKASRKRGIRNKSVVTAKNSVISDSEQASNKSDKDKIISIEISSSQDDKLTKETKNLSVNDTNPMTPINISSKKKDSENKRKDLDKDSLSLDSGQTSEKDKTSITSTSMSPKISASQSKELSKEMDELLIKDMNTATSVNVDSKRTSRKKGIGNKNMLNTKNSLIPNLEQSSKNNNKNSTTSVELSAKQTNKCSQSVSLHKLSVDHRSSLNSSNNELNLLIEIKDSLGNQSHKSSIVSPTVSKSNDDDNVLHSKKNSSSGLSRTRRTLKRKLSKLSNSRKKIKVTTHENQSNTPDNISDHLGSQMENPGSKLKKNSSKKKVTPLKLKDSCKKHSDVLITKSKASRSTSNLVQEPKKVKNKKASIQSTNKDKSTKKPEHGNSPEKSTENKHSLDESPEEQMELDSFHSIEKSDYSRNGFDNSADDEKAQEKMPDISLDERKSTERVKDAAKNTDDVVNNATDTVVAQIDFKSSVEFDEEMKKNYEAYCTANGVLKAQGTSIEELSEIPEMIDSLNSVPPEGVYFIMKSLRNSKVIVYMHESKTEMRNILNKL